MFRQLLAVVGNLPGLLLVTAGPFVAMLQGHLKYPEILVSDLMNVPCYKAVTGVVFTTTLAVNIYLLIESARHTRSRSPPELNRPGDVMISLVVFCAFPGVLFTIFFPFEEIGLEWFLHCLGAFMVFTAAAGMGFIYLVWCAPTLNKLELVPKEDARYRQCAGIAIFVVVVVGGAVRPFHFADPHTWAWVMLAVEVAFAMIAILAMMLGSWRTLAQMDRTDPVAYTASSVSKKD